MFINEKVKFRALLLVSLSFLIIAVTGAVTGCVPTTPPEGPVQIAVTVDDLPLTADIGDQDTRLWVVQKMIAALKKHAVPTPYGFTVGAVANDNSDFQDLVDLWVRSGFPVGNHSWFHRDLADVSSSEYIGDIQRTEQYLEKWKPSQKFYRYPYLSEGDTLQKRNDVRSYLAEQGIMVAQVTLDFDDWVYGDAYVRCQNQGNQQSMNWLNNSAEKGVISALHQSSAMSKTLFKRPVKQIMLVHMQSFTADMMDRILTKLKEEKVQFISLEDALLDPVYQKDSGYVSKQGTDFLDQFFMTQGLETPEPEYTTPVDQIQTICPSNAQ